MSSRSSPKIGASDYGPLHTSDFLPPRSTAKSSRSAADMSGFSTAEAVDMGDSAVDTGGVSSVPAAVELQERDEVTGEWNNTELHALYSSPDIIRNINSRRLRWAGHVARMGESRNAYRVLVGRPEGKRPLGRPRRRWEDNIKMDLREVGYDDRDWINLAQDRDRWRAYVRAAMNLRVP
ncbi:hypothetical protein ANN_11082 [Periplaneta americana]|uniref:Uncharacterized protein n=1 Tax=Periplaneta americana TaxID=6978 RepID=A0ABQ8T587_PERAM|nr:hypothetical protein ANN_11082 [Periplaneta americana]